MMYRFGMKSSGSKATSPAAHRTSRNSLMISSFDDWNMMEAYAGSAARAPFTTDLSSGVSTAGLTAARLTLFIRRVRDSIALLRICMYSAP